MLPATYPPPARIGTPPTKQRARLRGLLCAESQDAVGGRAVAPGSSGARDATLELGQCMSVMVRKVPMHPHNGRYGPPAAAAAAVAVTGERMSNRCVSLKLEAASIENIPSKMNIHELQLWEATEAEKRRVEKEQARHEAEQAGGRAGKWNPGTSRLSEQTDGVHGGLPSLLSGSTAPSKLGGGTSRGGLADGSSSPITDSLMSKCEGARTYMELLDMYSLHEFMIRKGRTLRSTPEFASFRRRYVHLWGAIEAIIQRLESLFSTYGVDVVYVDGKQLAGLAGEDLGRLLQTEDLLSCIANRTDVEPLLRGNKRIYRYGNRGADLAATRIQSAWRMHRCRVAYERLLIGTQAAIVIQRQWAVHRAYKMSVKVIQLNNEARLFRWKETMRRFTARWPIISQSRRIIVHLPSLSLPPFQCKKFHFFSVLQAGQLTRLADLRDPNVDIIMIMPFRPEDEALGYYFQLLEASGITNPAGRVTILAPENATRLPQWLSLTRMVLYSARLMKRISAACRGREAYIVPGIVGVEELALATQLGLPLLSAEPIVALALGTKNGGKRLLARANVRTPVGAYHVRNVDELLRVLAELMVVHRTDIARWLVKIDIESGSRGHAYFDTSRMRSLHGDTSETAEVTVDDLWDELKVHVAKRVRLVHPTFYPDWATFAKTFDIAGGCVEAVPGKMQGTLTANVFVAPTGKAIVESVVEPLLAPTFTVLGCSHPPQPFIPIAAIHDAAMSVAAAAYRCNVIGYLSVDFVVFDALLDSETGRRGPRLWGVDVDLYWTNNALAHRMAAVLNAARGDSVSLPRLSSVVRKSITEEFPQNIHTLSKHAVGGALQRSVNIGAAADCGLVYGYSGLLYNPYIAAIPHAYFFDVCRSKGLLFDTETHSGVAFHLVDVLLRSSFGALAVGCTLASVAEQLMVFQNTLNLEIPKEGERSTESNVVYLSSMVRQLAKRRSGPDCRPRRTQLLNSSE